MQSNTVFVLIIALLLCVGRLSAQFSYLETFDNVPTPNLPSGWSANNDNVETNNLSCAGGNSLRYQMYWASSTPVTTWDGFTSNGAAITVEYRCNVFDDNFGLVSPTFPWGVTIVIYEANNGTVFYEDKFTAVGPPYCTTRSFTVPANIVPANTPVKMSMRATTTNLPFYDYYTFIDNFSVVQSIPCASGLTPADGSTNHNSYTPLTWDAVPGASAYKVYFGATSSPPLVSTQSGNMYTTGNLQSNTTYYWKVVPETGSGFSGVDCPTYSFSTLHCTTALGSDVHEITVPYSVSGRSTCASGNDLTGANIPSGCLANSGYLAGRDAVYIFTPSVSALYDLKLTTGSNSDAAIILYNNCPLMTGTGNCLTSSVGTTGTERLISAYALTAGETYYLVVDNATLSNCISNYSLSIEYTRPGCVTLNAPANADNNIPAGYITLLWTPPLQNTATPYGYKVYFGTQYPPTNLVSTTADANTLVPALEQGTLYAWSVIAYGLGGDALDCTPYTFGTKMNNDACSDAAAFPGLPLDGSCTTMTVSTFGTSGGAPACQGVADDDVWYTFTVPNGYNRVQYATNNLTYGYMNVPVDNNRIFEIYNTCGGSAVGCYDAESGYFTNLTPGSSYYLRVFTQGSGVVSKFELCLKLAAPINDNCANALAFPTLTADGNCATMSGNTANATGSGMAPCGGNSDDDLWYTFTIPPGYTDAIYNTTYSAGSGLEYAVYNSCGGTLRSCRNQSYADIFSNLGPGTYRLQVYTNGAGSYSAFNICLRLRPPNDLYQNPIAFPAIPGDGACATQFINTFSSTNSGNVNGCYNSNLENDVWYTFVAPSGVTALEYLSSNGTSNFLMELFSNDGSYINCFGFNGDNTITNLTPGATYRLRIFSPGNPTGGSFDLCLKAAATAAPANDEPAGAFSITNAQGAFVQLGTQSLSQSTQSWFPNYCCTYNGFDPNNLGCCENPIPFDCYDYLPNAYDVWYKFTTNGGNVTISLNVLNTNLVLEVYTGSGMPDGAAHSSTACNAGNQISVSVTNLVAGTYYFRVYSTSYGPANFTISATGSALPVELEQFNGRAEKEGNVLYWTTRTEKNVAWHVIERSEEGTSWNEIGRTEGQNNTQTQQYYRFIDRTQLPHSFYRLRSVDYDGEFSLSSVILLTRKTEQSGIISVYPSPTNDHVSLTYAVAGSSSVLLHLTDITGRVLFSKRVETNTGINQTDLSLDDLPPGLYFITLEDPTMTYNPMRVVKQ